MLTILPGTTGGLKCHGGNPTDTFASQAWGALSLQWYTSVIGVRNSEHDVTNLRTCKSLHTHI